MRSSIILAAFLLLEATFVSSEDISTVLKAPTISYADLVSNFEGSDANHLLKSALTEEGLVAISDIPGFHDLRRDVLLESYKCGKQASAARTTVFGDGTERRTIAATASGVDKVNPMEFGTVNGDSCSGDFKRKADEFRSLVSTTSKIFTQRIGQLFSTVEGEPLLWHFDHTQSFDSMEDIVSNAEHLEHFHTYHKPTTTSETHDTSVSSNNDSSTIDLHADQGLFIAFTPAILVEDSEEGGDAQVTPLQAGNFYVQLLDGTTVTMDFGSTGDVLVLMLGDGVDQYFNNKLTQGPFLRAAPHGMVMPAHTESQHRVWYGRMFLPPMDALSEKHGISFGELRKRMIEDVHAGGGKGQGMGCSRALLETEGLQCADNQIYCWMRCMEYTEEANVDSCNELDLDVKCANQLGQIWHANNSHGDYNPTCSNDTHVTNPVTPTPEIPARPASCATADFAAFAGAEHYEYSMPLGFTGQAMLMWNVTADNKFAFKMAVKAHVGWLAIGPEAHAGGPHPGMNGAPIVMGVNDPDPDVPGMNRTAPFVGTSVREYVIAHSVSAFRHWSEPAPVQSAADAAIDVTECFTSMAFVADAVAGTPLNVTGLNNLIWGYHDGTYLKGYHGWTKKGTLHNFTATGIQATPPPSPNGAASPLFGSTLVGILYHTIAINMALYFIYLA